MMKRKSNENRIGGGVHTLNVSHGVRLWLSIILSFLCATLLCCAFLLPFSVKNNVTASAAVNVNDVVSWEGIQNYQLYRATSGDVGYGETYTLSSMGAPDSARGTSSFNAATATASGSKKNLGPENYVTSYVKFKAKVKIPAYTEYSLKFSVSMFINGITTDGAAHAWVDLYAFGETDKSGSITFGYMNGNSESGYVTPADVKLTHNSASSSSSGSNKNFPAQEAYKVTLTNDSNSEVTKDLYFGCILAVCPGITYPYWFNSTATMSAEIVPTKIAVPEADKSTDVYDVAGNVFTFTRDINKVELKSVSYTPAGGSATDITDSTTMAADGKCTLSSGAGTYTFTFELKDKTIYEWDSGGTDDVTIPVTINPMLITPPSGTVTTPYNGQEQSLSTVANKPGWYTANTAVFEDTAIIAMSRKFTDAGDNTVSVNLLSGNYRWSDYESNSSTLRSFNFNITKKPLTIKFEANADSGILEAKFADVSEIASRDSGSKYPTLVTKYSTTGELEGAVDAPTGTGNWYAIAVLTNADSCNYSVNAREPFDADKIKVAYPKLSASSKDKVNYDNKNITFKFTGFDPALMTYTVPTGAESFDGETLIAKNAGTYTIVYTLKDESLYEWSGTTSLSVEILPKNISIWADDDNKTSWSNGPAAELKFHAAVSGDSVQLVAAFTIDGSEEDSVPIVRNDDGSFTVSITDSWAAGNYTLKVKVADGENYTADEIEFNFTITAAGYDLDADKLVWQVNNKIQPVVMDEDGYRVLQYTGEDIKLTVDIRQYSDLEVREYGGDTVAKEIGEYEISVRIIAKDSDQYDFDKTFTLKYKIVPKVLDFSDAVWQWRYEGDGDAWETMSDRNMPPYDSKAVNVRISPEYFAGSGLEPNEYTVKYEHNDNLIEKGDKVTTAKIEIFNENYTTATGESCEVEKAWQITARALKYKWNTTQTINAGGKQFEFDAITFDDGKDYSQYFEYYYTVDGEEGEFTKEQLEAYLEANWSETNTITGKVCVRMTGVSDDFVIREGARSFSTGASKTELQIEISGGGQYGNVEFNFSAKKGEVDESARTTVTVAGRTFDGNKVSEITAYLNTLDASAVPYTVTVAVKDENYTLKGESSYSLTIEKFRITDDMWDKNSGKLKLPENLASLVEVSYKYYSDENATEEVDISSLGGGDKYYAVATLAGAKAGNFEFDGGTEENGIPTSKLIGLEKVEKSSIKDYLPIIIGVALGLLLLLALLLFLILRRRRADDYDDEYDDEYDYDDEDDEDEEDESDEDEDY